VVWLGVVSVRSASGSNQPGEGKVKTMVLGARGDQFSGRATMDLALPGLSQGARALFNDNLFRGWTRVGIEGGECSVVRKGEAPGAVTYQFVHTLWLRAGQITVQGLFTEQAVSGFDRDGVRDHRRHRARSRLRGAR
jgi:hypothetical protein